jgi:hypothetical protein
MEDEAIRAGFADLKPGCDYDGLHQSAVCRAEADWLVGINATKLIAKLRRLARKYPEQIFEARKEPRGAADYTVPKSCVILHDPHTRGAINAG